MSDQVHNPVMVQEVLEYLQPKEGGVYLDGTVGAGGHAKALLESVKGKAELIGLDRDAEILKEAKNVLKGFKKVSLHHASYKDAVDILNKNIDGILLDLGASSLQFDRPERGFSFKEEGPLDMRFDVDSTKTAADIVNTYREAELAQILKDYGEERFAKRIAKAMVEARKIEPVTTTVQLAELVKQAVPRAAWPKRIHVATRTFQALRIEVNDELEGLKEALPKLIGLLKPGGRIVILTFHSLEDRIVKKVFREEEKDCICPKSFPVCRCEKEQRVKVLTKKPVTPTKIEINQNPRARSTKLRVAERI